MAEPTPEEPGPSQSNPDQYIKAMLIEYETDNWKDRNLWEQFREDFTSFMEETFKACSTATKRKL